jgi:hypothetical protein
LGDEPISEWPHIKVYREENRSLVIDVCGRDWIVFKGQVSVQMTFPLEEDDEGEWRLTGLSRVAWLDD